MPNACPDQPDATLPGADPPGAAPDPLLEAYRARLAPADAAEEAALRELVSAIRRRDQLAAIELRLLDRLVRGESAELLPRLETIVRYAARLDREREQARAALEALRAERARAERRAALAERGAAVAEELAGGGDEPVEDMPLASPPGAASLVPPRPERSSAAERSAASHRSTGAPRSAITPAGRADPRAPGEAGPSPFAPERSIGREALLAGASTLSLAAGLERVRLAAG